MRILSFLAITLLLLSCGGGEEKVDYHLKMTGIWQLANIPDVMKAGNGLGNSAEDLRQSTLNFYNDGSLVIQLGAQEQKGKWEVAENGSWIKMYSENFPDDKFALTFENERTIIIKNNGKIFKFKKKSDEN
jgi:hypothetical protein